MTNRARPACFSPPRGRFACSPCPPGERDRRQRWISCPVRRPQPVGAYSRSPSCPDIYHEVQDRDGSMLCKLSLHPRRSLTTPTDQSLQALSIACSSPRHWECPAADDPMQEQPPAAKPIHRHGSGRHGHRVSSPLLYPFAPDTERAYSLDRSENATLGAEEQRAQSQNMDDTGFFSISVLEKVSGIPAAPIRSVRISCSSRGRRCKCLISVS